MTYPGSTPSLVSSASPASLSAMSLQCLTHSDDGFYRLPLTPSVHSARPGARSREATSDLSFPLPPLPDSAALLLDRAAAAQTAGGGSFYGSSGGATPSPTYSLPSSPPPSSAPPNLPDFVSVFVNPATSGERTGSVSRDTYPPVPPSPRPIPSHVRQLDSISSSVLSPPRASQHLRQRVLPSPDTRSPHAERHEAIECPAVDDVFETASIVAKKRRTEAWLSAIPSASRPPDASSERATLGAGSLRSGLTWLARARPGWAIRSEGQGWAGEKLSDLSDSGHRGPAGPVALSGKGGWKKALPTSRKARISLAVALVVVLLLAVGLATGLTREAASQAGSVDCRCENGGRARASSDGRCFCACPDAWGGTSCHLDATCVDVGAGAARPVAQGLLDVAASASELWQPEVNTTRLATVLHDYILPTSPSSSGTTCQSQLSLLALPSLSFSAFPSRLRWTESALLHTLALTESNSSLAQFRTFASSLSFSQFGDAPVTVPSTNYQLVAGGYLFDLATLERSVRAEQTWEKVVDPPSEAVALIGPASLAVLDRMSAQASAANAQRSRALAHYWVDSLAVEEETLDAFRAAVKAASMVLPVEEVDGVQRGVALACRPGLNAEEAVRINEVEGGIFCLAEVQAGQAGNSSCTDRPIYGMLNLLNRSLLSSANSSSPLSVTSIDQNTISSRLTYHAGALLSPLSLANAFSSSPSAPSARATPERIGLALKLDHVLLDYLLLLPSLDAARELVQYLTQEPAAIDPPDGRDFPVLAAERDEEWPVLEVQLWGGWVAG
ncbi:hypothetical protein Rhopal_002558-T1 [Rhodotorula paludigena]|uniref:EGF-like domain-containing protein n=1 Tax=Rhodotorula paludigena TaxID=86838 RepID=A0AAV5GAW9_9BASI|nr:hypothetical protein Rhopal_002558-T1 [Rhodotorula paludigena]